MCTQTLLHLPYVHFILMYSEYIFSTSFVRRCHTGGPLFQGQGAFHFRKSCIRSGCNTDVTRKSSQSLLYVSRWLQFILLLSFLDCLPQDRAQHWWRDSKEIVNKSLARGWRREMDLTGYKGIDGLYAVTLRSNEGKNLLAYHLYETTQTKRWIS